MVQRSACITTLEQTPTHRSAAAGVTSLNTTFSPTMRPHPVSMHCTRPLSASSMILRSRYSFQQSMQNLWLHPSESVLSGSPGADSATSQQQIGHSKASDFLLREAKAEAEPEPEAADDELPAPPPRCEPSRRAPRRRGEVTLSSIGGSACLLVEGDDGGLRPAAASVRVGSSQKDSVSFSLLQR